MASRNDTDLDFTKLLQRWGHEPAPSAAPRAEPEQDRDREARPQRLLQKLRQDIAAELGPGGAVLDPVLTMVHDHLAALADQDSALDAKAEQARRAALWLLLDRLEDAIFALGLPR